MALTWTDAKYWGLEYNKPVTVTARDEIALPDDNRRPVPYYERRPGTRYYSIARLTVQFASGAGGVGTGFMVNDTILMTAGHCVWDWKTKNEPAARLIVSFGYHDETGHWDEHRYGRAVLMSNYHDHSLDFAFVLLSDRIGPYANVPILPFRWYDTPLQGSIYLCIPGYPGDRHALCNRMYEGAKLVDWNLISEIGRLRHQISTFQGQSGSPILLPDRMHFIGIHVAGDESASANYGTPTANIGTLVGPYTRALSGREFRLKTPAETYGAITVQQVSVNLLTMGVGNSVQGLNAPYLSYLEYQ